MKSWPEVALGDICEFRYGKSLPERSRDGGEFPVYGSNGVVGHHSKSVTSGATIVIGRKGSFGEVAYSPTSAWPIDTAYYVDETSTRADLKWLSYRLGDLGLTSLNKSAAVPGLNRDDAYRQRLLLPPLDEQRKIAAILDQADAIRAKRRQVLAHLDSLTQSIFHDMFGDRDFPMVEAKTLMPSMRNGVSPSSGGEYRADVLTLTAITQGAFNPDAKKTAMFAREPSDDKRVTASDFLMCRGNGNRSLVGVGVIPRMSRPDLVFPDTVIAGSVDTSVVTPDFLEVVWTRPATRDQIESKARTTSGIHKINQQTLSEVLVPLPPMALQQKFATLLTGVRTRRHLVEEASNVDDELFASLQSRAFRGEL